MDTLISVGVSAAYLWSLWALFFGHAGMAGMKMEFSLFPQQEGGADHIYLEVAAAVTVFILRGDIRSPRQEAVGCSPYAH